jgi:hypothetical protein
MEEKNIFHENPVEVGSFDGIYLIYFGSMHWNISGRYDTHDHLILATEIRLGEVRSFGDMCSCSWSCCPLVQVHMKNRNVKFVLLQFRNTVVRPTTLPLAHVQHSAGDFFAYDRYFQVRKDTFLLAFIRKTLKGV